MERARARRAFAAFEQPEFFVDGVHAFFRLVRSTWTPDGAFPSASTAAVAVSGGSTD